ncbi:MAG: aminotransferase class IV [Acetobacteraceae bacterium]|nr:aminotransferase class IV [Acetobacteraceae bacterium]
MRDGWRVAPSRWSDVLESVTHDTVLVLDGEMGLPVEERPVDRTEIYVAEEAFICGTGQEL